MADDPSETSAGERVLNTTELLESILIHFDTDTEADMRTLLLIQRVNHMFRNTIANSPKLQQALWFTTSAELEKDMTVKINPLVHAALFVYHFSAYPLIPGTIWKPSNLDRAVDELEFSSTLPGSWKRMMVARGSVARPFTLRQKRVKYDLSEWSAGMTMADLVDRVESTKA